MKRATIISMNLGNKNRGTEDKMANEGRSRATSLADARREAQDANVPFQALQRQEKATEAAMRVPIDRIFDVESDALGIEPLRKEKIRKRYERYISRVIKISLSMVSSPSQRRTPERLAEAMKSLDEKGLFSVVFASLALEIKLGREDSLVSAVEGNTFNCYSSTVLVADALTRLGKPVNVIITPKHIFLTGEKYALDMVSHVPVLPLESALSFYPMRWETTADKLLGEAYVKSGRILINAGRSDEALAAYAEATTVDPENVHLWIYRVGLLAKMGRREEAEEYLKKINELMERQSA